MSNSASDESTDETCAEKFDRLIVFDEERSQLRSYEPGLTSLKILVADDEAAPAKLLRDEFERLGHTVAVVQNGREANTALENEDFDCAFIDMMMPYMDGIEVIQWIRKHPVKNGLWIALMTAQAKHMPEASRDSLGANYYLSKQIDIKDLFRKV